MTIWSHQGQVQAQPTPQTAIASTSYTPIASSSASMNRSTSQHSSALNSRTHSRQTSAQQQQHPPHFFQHGHPSSSSSSSLFYPHNHSSGASSSALSTPLGGSGILPSLSGYAGSIPASVRTTSQREVVIPPAPHGCPAFLHRILLTHDAAYRRRIFEGLAYNHQHQPQSQPPPWQNEESDADSTLSHRRTETPASSIMSASTTTTMSGSTSTLGGAIPPRTPSQFPQPNIPTSLPFLEPLIPPENFAMVNSKLYRSSLPLKKHFPFLKTLNLRSVLTLILEEYPASNTTFLDENGIQFFQFGLPGNKEPFVQIPEDMISNALIAILDVRNHPMLIHCNKGKHRTGCLVGCLRKLQQWSLTTIFDEYRKFSAPKSRSMDQEFVELYAGEEAVWTRVEPRWVPRWAGLPRGRVIGHEDDDEEEEEEQDGDGEGEAGGYSLDEEGEEEEYDDEEELDLNLSERGRRRRRASFYSAMEVH
ncbi:hypothetical protein A4X09_0g5431 [Tilletia walkeri]|uniref:diphosphoinositol-polyphosphate diphosphatase n=1 Tax=Tilletia walkeri TaxID=117179 RepID=A0A8X7N4H9_9BASI|nr:hypothetical protein A4X09_0g5431 [Tilletia walkeri]